MAFDRDKSGRGIYVCIVKAEALFFCSFRTHFDARAWRSLRFSEAEGGSHRRIFFFRIPWLGAAEALTAFLA